MSRHTYRMGIIGNGQYMAYVDETGNICWLCWPQFDSFFVFGSLLDEKKGGEFSIRPISEFQSHQYYFENTNLLCTEFRATDGKFRIVDFAPLGKTELHRRIEVLEGNPKVTISYSPLKDLHLNCDLPLNEEFELKKDTTIALGYSQKPESFENSFSETKEYWEKWVGSLKLPKTFQKEVTRSALALKLHQFSETGAIIAAGTTSLPESPGSTRNWDYRYTWVRDSYYTLSALNLLGSTEEAEGYSKFLKNYVLKQKERYQPMYKIDGSHEIEESTLDLKGYQGNQPVRIGNAAYFQIQNDVYGQIMLSLKPLYESKKLKDLEIVSMVLDHIEKTMDEPDAGLWEFRGLKFKHGYTFLLHWAGANAAIEIAKIFGDEELEKRAESLKERAAQQIEGCFDKEKKVYASSIGGKNLDASLFQLIALGYLKKSEKAEEHVESLRKDLQVNGPLFYRYKHEDDFGVAEVAFLVCGFWYAEALAYLGKKEETKEALYELIKCSNDLGLFSEDADPKDYSQWGNFVQTYSHAGLIHVAFALDL